MKNTVPSIYIHIPFCDSICSYCDFPKLLSRTNYQDAYLERLILELKKVPQREFFTAYIGGGTPSSLSPSQLDLLLAFIARNFHVKEEFTFEANPENLTEEKIKLLSKYGVNRVSLGVQSFKETSLKILNRKHTKKDVIACISLLHKYGINNINLDFIFGLKEENQRDYLENITLASELGVKHISYYSLQIEPGTVLFKKPELRKEADAMADDYEEIVKKLADRGYKRYEVSNFSLPDCQSKHNLTYWRNRSYYGIGLGATGLVNHRRIVQTRNILKYIYGKDTVSSTTYEDEQETEFNYLMLNLRLEQGFELEEYHRLFKKDFLLEYQSEIQELKEELIITSTRVRVRPEKMYILDSILVDLLHFKEN